MKFVILTMLIGSMIVGAGVYLSIYFGDAYIFRRFGALTTAYAAIIVLVQIALENRFEKIKEEMQMNKSAKEMSPAEEEFFDRFNANKMRVFARQRTNIAICVALFAVIGEIIHGFGDFVLHLIVII